VFVACAGQQVVHTDENPTFVHNAWRGQGRSGGSMKKFVAARPFADPDAAARKIVEIANDVEAVQDGRIYIERVNEPFLAAGGSGDDFRAGIERAIALGWLWLHESGTRVGAPLPYQSEVVTLAIMTKKSL